MRDGHDEAGFVALVEAVEKGVQLLDDVVRCLSHFRYPYDLERNGQRRADRAGLITLTSAGPPIGISDVPAAINARRSNRLRT